MTRILAELGEGPSMTNFTAPPRQEEKIQVNPEPVTICTDTRESVESASAKKKKRKKEKEKEKKAATAAEKDAKSKVAEKKLPKHVREMQEALARRKEAEERKKREEEERLRKEEEERLRQEELQRQEEEATRRRKEREKEKLLKKKQEGKLLTGKQKEEARRLEAMRNQILANAGGCLSLPEDKEGAPAKRPIYQTKKSRPANQNANNAAASTKPEENIQAKEKQKEQQEIKEAVNSADDEKVDEVNSHNVEDKSAEDAAEENGMVQHNAAPPAVTKPMIEAKKLMAYRSNISGDGEREEDLRSPICCVMGHVDAGKTKLLDCIRGTNVQGGEAGGITQQIGATYFPAENIQERTKELKANAKLKVSGLLVFDTPGHESFTNLRLRGSGLCDIAILVVDITMHELKPQTIESLNLLRTRNTEFIVALNKVDRLSGWKVSPNAPITKAIKEQSKEVLAEFNWRVAHVISKFKEQGLNTELYYKKREMGETFSIVPTSAITGEGIPDLLLLLVQWAQKTMVEKLTFSDKVQCTVLEVKVIGGHGTTIDVVLVNGVLHKGDRIVVCGLQGPIVTSIKTLLTPRPMKEIRVKGEYDQPKEIKAAQGIKIAAQGLEHAIPGTGLRVVGPDDVLEDIIEEAKEDMLHSVMSEIDISGEGVYIQASTLGSLEALLKLVKTPEVNIPVSGINIGPVHNKDVRKASAMLQKKSEYATILAFDVEVTPQVQELSDELGVRIFVDKIIYSLVDEFKKYVDGIKEKRKEEVAGEAIFPCLLKILPDKIIRKKNPIILGVKIIEGTARIGTPICIPKKRGIIDIGRIASIEEDGKRVDVAEKGQEVAIKIIGSNPKEQQREYGRHFHLVDELVSHISRRSIDALKANYREELIKEKRLVQALKITFKIP